MHVRYFQPAAPNLRSTPPCGECATQQACDLLAPVYDWFTEGFDTLDLKLGQDLAR
jgi:hypothetical protein